MCLLVYSDLLPRMIHDEIMRAVESTVGQQSKNLADALFRVRMADGRNPLEVIHRESFMKKVQTKQVIMTPTTSSSIRLDELNTILTEMAKGEEAVKRMAEVDNAVGLQKRKRDNSPQNVGEPMRKEVAEPVLKASETEVLSDEAIAAHQTAQATRMRAEAKSMLAEATRLEAEAAKMGAPKVVKTTKKVPSKKSNPAPINVPAAKKAKKAKV